MKFPRGGCVAFALMTVSGACGPVDSTRVSGPSRVDLVPGRVADFVLRVHSSPPRDAVVSFQVPDGIRVRGTTSFEGAMPDKVPFVVESIIDGNVHDLALRKLAWSVRGKGFHATGEFELRSPVGFGVLAVGRLADGGWGAHLWSVGEAGGKISADRGALTMLPSLSFGSEYLLTLSKGDERCAVLRDGVVVAELAMPAAPPGGSVRVKHGPLIRELSSLTLGVAPAGEVFRKELELVGASAGWAISDVRPKAMLEHVSVESVSAGIVLEYGRGRPRGYSVLHLMNESGSKLAVSLITQD